MHNIDFSQYPVLLLLYFTGSSGEFIAHALTQSIPAITKTQQFWENQTRCKYFDFFDRALNSGNDRVDEETVHAGIQRYLELNKPNTTTHLGLVHPHPASLHFVSQYFKSSPLIEITLKSPVSQKFRHLAASSKVNSGEVYRLKKYESGFAHEPKLLLEWDEIILTKTKETFQQIQEFLNVDGSVETFELLIQDYCRRNQDLISQL